MFAQSKGKCTDKLLIRFISKLRWPSVAFARMHAQLQTDGGSINVIDKFPNIFFVAPKKQPTGESNKSPQIVAHDH